jgi:hypothetical protein
VHKDAKEGVDYTLDRLLPIWQRTSEQVRDEPTFLAHEGPHAVRPACGLGFAHRCLLRAVVLATQDWELCELNQLGVNSSRHTPGLYSEKKEVN